MGSDSRDSVAVVIYRDAGVWQSGLLPQRVTDDLAGLVAVLRQQPADNGAIALVNVADEFFVAARVRGADVRLLLSDVTAAAAWDLAKQVVEALEIGPPGEGDMEEVWPAGDLSIFADLGLDELELAAVLADLDAYADEMLLTVAARLGAADVYDHALDAVLR